MTVRSDIDSDQGFHTKYKFSDTELELVRGLIFDQWLSCLAKEAPEHAKDFETLGMERYHELSHVVPHAKMWGKLARILPAESAKKFRTTSLIKNLETEFGTFEITDEDNVGHEEIYWRIVRPEAAGDIGPLHADRWFFEFGEKEIPSDKRMVKVWCAIYCQPGKSGLRVLPGSHRKEWKHHGERRDGFIKPVFDEDEKTLDMKTLITEPGQAIVFNDLLLHGGIPTTGDKTRVSIEFAMFVPKDRFDSKDYK